MKKHPISRWGVRIYGAAAIIWTINSIVSLTTSRYDGPSSTDIMLYILCAVIWWIAFLVQVIRYRKGKKDDP